MKPFEPPMNPFEPPQPLTLMERLMYGLGLLLLVSFVAFLVISLDQYEPENLVCRVPEEAATPNDCFDRIEVPE